MTEMIYDYCDLEYSKDIKYNKYDKYINIFIKKSYFFNITEIIVYNIKKKFIYYLPVKHKVPKKFKNQIHFYRNSYNQNTRTTSHIPTGTIRRSLQRNF